MGRSLNRLCRSLLKLGVVYAILQVLVGFEVGVFIVYLHLAQGLSMPSAMVTAMPVGMPLLVAQGALFLMGRAWLSGTPSRAVGAA